MTSKHPLQWHGKSLDQQIIEVEERLALRKLTAHVHAQALEQRLRSTLGLPTTLLLAAGIGVLLGQIRLRPGAPAPAAPSVSGHLIRALIAAFVR